MKGALMQLKCYGAEDIVLSVDKQVIYSLCHSAIQEIDRQQLADKERIANLETDVATIKTEYDEFKTQINDITSIINKLKTASSFEDFKSKI